MRLLTELSLLSAPGSRERGWLIHKEAIENFKGVVWLIWARAHVTASLQAGLVLESTLINALSHSPSFALSVSLLCLPLNKFLCSHISLSILSLLFLSTLLSLHFLQSLIQIVFSSVLHFSMCRKLCTEDNLIRTIRHIETTNQTILLHRQAWKQIKLADLLTLYFLSLF